jgi:hypothetical protein
VVEGQKGREELGGVRGQGTELLVGEVEVFFHCVYHALDEGLVFADLRVPVLEVA